MAKFGEILLLYEWPTPWWAKLWIFAKIFVKEGVLHGQWKGLFFWRRVGGQYTLPRTVREGLDRLGVAYAVNDFAANTRFETCYVLRDARCLRFAIAAKRAGRIEKLIAGPMIVNFPFEADHLIENDAIDTFLLPSDWTKQLFTRLGRGNVNYQVWPLGIDCEFWRPPASRERATWLIYVKNPEPGLLKHVLKEMRALNLPVRVLTAGTFHKEEYRRALAQAAAAVFLSRSESQGLAMFEAWACDVPTLHWNPGEVHLLQNRYAGASSCPYLTAECGRDFVNQASFRPALEDFRARLDQFKPRDHVAHNFELSRTIKDLLNFRDLT